MPSVSLLLRKRELSCAGTAPDQIGHRIFSFTPGNQHFHAPARFQTGSLGRILFNDSTLWDTWSKSGLGNVKNQSVSFQNLTGFDFGFALSDPARRLPCLLSQPA